MLRHGACLMFLCLQRKQRSKLTPDCAYELFRKEAQDAGDIRLSVRLFRACLPDKKQFCADVPPGQALASHCLEEHRESLSDACRCVGRDNWYRTGVAAAHKGFNSVSLGFYRQGATHRATFAAQGVEHFWRWKLGRLAKHACMEQAHSSRAVYWYQRLCLVLCALAPQGAGGSLPCHQPQSRAASCMAVAQAAEQQPSQRRIWFAVAGRRWMLCLSGVCVTSAWIPASRPAARQPSWSCARIWGMWQSWSPMTHRSQTAYR